MLFVRIDRVSGSKSLDRTIGRADGGGAGRNAWSETEHRTLSPVTWCHDKQDSCQGRRHSIHVLNSCRQLCHDSQLLTLLLVILPEPEQRYVRSMATHAEISASLTRDDLFVSIGYISASDIKRPPHRDEDLPIGLYRSISLEDTAKRY